jgi:hypothetical protein
MSQSVTKSVNAAAKTILATIKTDIKASKDAINAAHKAANAAASAESKRITAELMAARDEAIRRIRAEFKEQIESVKASYKAIRSKNNNIKSMAMERQKRSWKSTNEDIKELKADKNEQAILDYKPATIGNTCFMSLKVTPNMIPKINKQNTTMVADTISHDEPSDNSTTSDDTISHDELSDDVSHDEPSDNDTISHDNASNDEPSDNDTISHDEPSDNNITSNDESSDRDTISHNIESAAPVKKTRRKPKIDKRGIKCYASYDDICSDSEDEQDCELITQDSQPESETESNSEEVSHRELMRRYVDADPRKIFSMSDEEFVASIRGMKWERISVNSRIRVLGYNSDSLTKLWITGESDRRYDIIELAELSHHPEEYHFRRVDIRLSDTLMHELASE